MRSAALKRTAQAPVEGLIHIVRGHEVMLDRDIAGLYGVETKALNRAVKRNSKRFPVDIMFQLTGEEAENLRCHSGTSSGQHGGRRYLPYVFTEHGVVMLSAVLNSERAINMSLAVVRAFVRMRKLIATNREFAARLEKLERGQERTGSVLEVLVEDIDRLAAAVARIKNPPVPPKRKIGYIHHGDD